MRLAALRGYGLTALGLIAWGGASAAAAPIERDLGQRLAYVRVHQLPDELPVKPAGRLPATVLDVRFVDTDAAGATALVAWVKARATPRTPVFVLANATMAGELVKALALLDKDAGVLVVGIEVAPFKPDIAVNAAAADERRAYDALEQGAEIGTLLADNPTKVRHDEASLAKDRPAELPPGATTTGEGRSVSPSLVEPPPAKVTAPPIDATLQRAVHLHRTLVALKKL